MPHLLSGVDFKNNFNEIEQFSITIIQCEIVFQSGKLRDFFLFFKKTVRMESTIHILIFFVNSQV